jgi:DNA mismatch repair ATPase MutL
LNLQFDTDLFSIYESLASSFSELGFEFSILGKQHLILRQAPKLLQDVNFSKFIPRLIASLKINSSVEQFIKEIAKLAPQHIDKILNQVTMEKLLFELEKLNKTELAAVFVKIDLAEIKKLFHLSSG